MKSLSEIIMKTLKESILDNDFDLELIEEKIVDAVRKYTSVVPNKFVVTPWHGSGPYRMLTSFDDLKKMLDFIGIKYKEVDSSKDVIYGSDLVLDMGVEFETVGPHDKKTYKKNRYLILTRMGDKLPFEWGCLFLMVSAGHSVGFGLINDDRKLKIDWSKERNDDDTRKVYQCGMNKNTQKTLIDVLTSIYKAQNEISFL